MAAGTTLVCAYFRVAPAAVEATIRSVRELQRILAREFGAVEAEVLVRCELPGAVPEKDRTEDATLMETYRLPDAVPAAAFIARLAALAGTSAVPSRGTRHLEVFRPCAW